MDKHDYLYLSDSMIAIAQLMPFGAMPVGFHLRTPEAIAHSIAITLLRIGISRAATMSQSAIALRLGVVA